MPGEQLAGKVGVVPPQRVALSSNYLVQADQNNSLRKVCFGFLVVLVFIRFSMLHQLLTYRLGVNVYLLYIFGIPSVVGCLFTGGIRRISRFRPTLYWTGFALCIAFASVFSAWRGGSVALVAVYLRTDFLMLPVIGGLAVGWKECRTLIYTIGLATIMSEISIKLSSIVDIHGRTTLAFGTIQNSNDYAAHLILIVPFLLWVSLCSKSFVLRIIAMLGVGYGCYLIIASASRGGFIALVVGGLAMLYLATPSQKIAVLIAGAVMLVGAIAFVPSQVFQRIFSLSEDSAGASEEALESSRIRKQLLQDSIVFAITHPVFGVGPGQFGELEGMSRKLESGVGLYYEAHNSYMTVASECGTPALIFYLAGILSPFMLLSRIRRQAGTDPAAADVRNAVLCIRISLVAFCTAILFVNFAYFFYLPALAGLIIAMAAAFPEVAGGHPVQINPVQKVRPLSQTRITPSPEFVPRKRPQLTPHFSPKAGA